MDLSKKINLKKPLLIAEIGINHNGSINEAKKLIDLAKIIKKETNCSIQLKNQNKKVIEPKINIARIKKEFNYMPKFNFENEIINLVNSFADITK